MEYRWVLRGEVVGVMETGRWDYSGFLKGYIELQRNQPEFLARSGSRDLDVWDHRVLALAPSGMKTCQSL